MNRDSGAAGLAALAICESMLLSVTDNKVLDAAEVRGVLTDAAAHRGSVQLTPDGNDHEAVALLIEGILKTGKSVWGG